MNKDNTQSNELIKSWPELIQHASGDLSRVFRHMLPGVVILGVAYLSHPTWFETLDASQGWHLVILVVIAIAIGNFWYVLHRYTLHQLLDWICYRIREKKWKGYSKWFYKHVCNSFSVQKKVGDLWKHVHFRSAQIIFMFIVGEVLLLFVTWHDTESTIASFRLFFGIAGIFLVIVSIIQSFLSNALDVHVVETYRDKNNHQSASVSFSNKT